MRTFTYDYANFLLNGKSSCILSGAMHYFRVHPFRMSDNFCMKTDLRTISSLI